MYKTVIFAIVLTVCLCSLAAAAPLSDILDAATAIQKIIAEYEKLPGTSRHYPAEVATLVDPNHFTVHLVH